MVPSVVIHIYRGWPKKSSHRQKYSQFDLTVNGRTEMKENRIFFKSFLGDLI